MRVMGIDPGISHTGYGIVDAGENGGLTHISNGTIQTSSRLPFVDRLSKIHLELEALFQQFKPQHMAVEEIFFARNVRSALLLGQARGVALLSASLAGIPVFEYSVTALKMAVCRYGRADKEQVGAMVKILLQVDQKMSSHASDALAACICHAHNFQTLQVREAGRTSRNKTRKGIR